MAFTSNTQIAGPLDPQAIDTFRIGDKVLAASLVGGRLSWSPQTVEYSGGTAPGPQEGMVYIVCADRTPIIATPYQVFLVTGNKLKQAQQLIPGERLVSESGAPVSIEQVSVGRFTGAIWAIATSRVPAPDPNNHLIIANGIVVGDFMLEAGAGDSGRD